MTTYEKLIRQVRKTANEEGVNHKTSREAEDRILAHVLKSKYGLRSRRRRGA